MSVSDNRDHVQVLREALCYNREAMYLYNVDFFHWVNTRAQLLLQEVEDQAYKSEEKQSLLRQKYEDLFFGRKGSVDDED